MKDMAEFKFWIKYDGKKNNKNEMYINKHQIILKNTKKDNNLKHKNKLYQPLKILKNTKNPLT